ncbi:MAG: DUF1800 domain-containing protein [Candidatus Sulfotelmatobacter sp.]
MRSSFAKLSASLLCLSLACAVPQLLAGKKEKSEEATNDQRRAVHALNRLTFGPRPGDVQLVLAIGVDRWIDQQLHPEKITDSAVEARLAPFRTLHMSPKEIAEEFPDGQMIKQVMDGKRPMPSDPARRAIYQVQIARFEHRQGKKQEKATVASAAVPSVAPAASGPSAEEGAKTAEELAAAAAASPDAMPASVDNNTVPPTADGGSMTGASAAKDGSGGSGDMAAAPGKTNPAVEADRRRRDEDLESELDIRALMHLPADERYRKVLAMPTDEQVAFAGALRHGKAQDLLADMNPSQRETLLAMNNPQGVLVDELAQAKLLRAIYSDRQLEQVMTDFWFNHFNVFVGKGPERLLLTNYEQQVIRPHAMGKFEDLLIATAKSPAMLFYLDNWLSVGPNSMQALGVPAHPARRGPYGYPRPNPNAKRKANSGLNENYGRELLELHTLSVNGGYTQRDVTEVAKVFTGWTIEKPNDGGEFRFDPRKHEPGPKVVLGHRIKPKGEDEGMEVLHLLATSPKTAHFISLKLAQRFVSDDPPPALVDRMAKTFQKKKGDIREVLATMFHSPEFWADSAYRDKVKTPLEFVASAVRATGADVDDAMPLTRQLNNMGMPLYGAVPPTGYSMKAETWVSSSALLTRMNFALALTSGRVRGVKLDAAQLAGGSPQFDTVSALSSLEAKLLSADVSKQTHDSIAAQIQNPSNEGPTKNGMPDQNKKAPQPKLPDPAMIAGLLLGSPEFQKR